MMASASASGSGSGLVLVLVLLAGFHMYSSHSNRSNSSHFQAQGLTSVGLLSGTPWHHAQGYHSTTAAAGWLETDVHRIAWATRSLARPPPQRSSEISGHHRQ
uniref:Uncharacterized protein n=1 Tax=Tetraselmis sp. GSL018 TaxID=582737 RepID=A0A061R937_9CHLO